MTRILSRSFLRATAFAAACVLVPAVAPAAQEAGEREREPVWHVQPEEPVPPAEEEQLPLEPEAAPESPRLWTFEVFGQGATNGVHVSVEDYAAVNAFGELAENRLSGSNSRFGYGGGAGFRAFRGRLGVEGFWRRAHSEDLTPFSINTELDFDLGGDVDSVSTADLYVGQCVYRLPFRPFPVAMFVGLGGGVVHVSSQVTEELLSGEALEAIPDNFRSLVSYQFVEDQLSPVIGGSVGFSVAAGPVFIRPRFDIYFGRELSTALDLGLSSRDVAGGVDFDLNSSVTPRFMMFSVDVGLTNR